MGQTLKVTVVERSASGSGLYTTHDPSGKYQDQNYTLIEAAHTILSKNNVELFFTTQTGEGVLRLRFNNPLSNGRLAAGSYTCSRDQNAPNGTLYHTEYYGNSGYFNSGTVTVSADGDNYTFTANNIGTTNGLTATLSYTGKLTYTNEYVAVSSVTLNETDLSLTVGGGYQLEATVNPSNAFNKNVTWSTSNSDVASVNTNGYVYTSIAGSATITATTEDGAKVATCAVTVNPREVTGSGTFTYKFDDNSNVSTFSPTYVEDRGDQINFGDGNTYGLLYFNYSTPSKTLEAGLYEWEAGSASSRTWESQKGEFGKMQFYCENVQDPGTINVTKSGDTYTITLNWNVSETGGGGRSGKITGTYTGKIVSSK